MNGEQRVPDSVTACQAIEDQLEFKQCLCRHLGLSCDNIGGGDGSSSLPPFVSTTMATLVQPDWSRSYSISAGLCILFLAMCAVIIVLRVLKPRYQLHAAPTRSSLAAGVAIDPPPYDVVTRSPPSYSVLQPPAYQRSFIEKIPTVILEQTIAAAAGRPRAGSLGGDFPPSGLHRTASATNGSGKSEQQPPPHSAAEVTPMVDDEGSPSPDTRMDVRFTLGDDASICGEPEMEEQQDSARCTTTSHTCITPSHTCTTPSHSFTTPSDTSRTPSTHTCTTPSHTSAGTDNNGSVNSFASNTANSEA